jgi:hypothetical protein
VVVQRSEEADLKNLWTGGDPPLSNPRAVQIGCSILSAPDMAPGEMNASRVVTFDARGCLDPVAGTLAGCADSPAGPRCAAR